MHTIKILLPAVLLVGIAGCGWFGGGEEYEQSTALPPLEVPPGLSALPHDDRLAVPDLPSGRVSAVETAQQNRGETAPVSETRGTGIARREPSSSSFPERGQPAPASGESAGSVADLASETSSPADTNGDLQIIEGLPVLVVAEPFDRTWQRTGAALERIGLTVEDEDPTRGVYYVRYQGSDNTESGPLGELFDSSNGLTPGSRYSVYLLKQGTQTLITAHAEPPVPENAAADVLRLITAALQDTGATTGSG